MEGWKDQLRNLREAELSTLPPRVPALLVAQVTARVADKETEDQNGDMTFAAAFPPLGNRERPPIM